MTLEEYAIPYGDRLIATVKAGVSIPEALTVASKAWDDFDRDAVGDTEAKRLALLNSFRDRYAPPTKLASAINDRLAGLDHGSDQAA
jgi:hypothetical protein